MVSKTRKTRKGGSGSSSASSSGKGKPMSILQLRRAFEHIDRFVDSKVSKLSEKEGLAAFCREWKKTFGKEVSQIIAKDYLLFVKTHKGVKGQKGGSVTYSPAPIGYDMAPGTGTVSVPPYATYAASGMSVNQDSVASTCGSPSAFLPPSPDVGTNEVAKGGRRRNTRKGRGNKKNEKKQQGGSLGTAFYEFVSRPAGMSSPPGPVQDLQMLSKGYNEFASPRPEINNIATPYNPIVYNASINPISRQF
jgi:hypothetical protein